MGVGGLCKNKQGVLMCDAVFRRPEGVGVLKQTQSFSHVMWTHTPTQHTHTHTHTHSLSALTGTWSNDIISHIVKDISQEHTHKHVNTQTTPQENKQHAHGGTKSTVWLHSTFYHYFLSLLIPALLAPLLHLTPSLRLSINLSSFPPSLLLLSLSPLMWLFFFTLFILT